MRFIPMALALAALLGIQLIAAADRPPVPTSAPTPMPQSATSEGVAEILDGTEGLDDAGTSHPAPVVVYSTSWCTFCVKAKDWLTERGIEFVERDIEDDPEAALEIERKALAAGITKGGVPMFDIDGEIVRGFDVPKLEELLDRRVKPASMDGD